MTKRTKKTSAKRRWALIAVVFLLAAGLALCPLRLFLADLAFAEGLAHKRRTDYHLAAESFRKATKFNPYEPAYHRELAAALVYQIKEHLLSEEGSEAIPLTAQLAQEGEREALRAYSLNPFNSLTLKSILKTYYELAKYLPTYQSSAEKVGEQLLELSPTEARGYYSVALIYAAGGKTERSLKLAKKAVNLKPDFKEAQKLVGILESKSNPPQQDSGGTTPLL